MNNFLWFLLFLSIPVLVHLFSFRRAKKLLFTNVRFIQLVSSKTKSKTKLRQLLVLGARVLAFVFFVSAFVLSVVEFDEKGIAIDNSFGLIYLDNSRSTVGSDVEEEVNLVYDLVVSSFGESGKLVTNDFGPFSNRNRSKGEIFERLVQVEVSYGARSLSEVLDRDRVSRSISIISDFEDATVVDLDRVAQDSLRNYSLFVKRSEEIRNVYVDSVWIEKDIEDYSNVILKCTLGHSKDYKEGNMVVKLLDDKGGQISSVVKAVQGGPMLSFTLPSVSVDRRYTIQLSGDEVVYDNDFYFVLKETVKPKVLLLSDRGNKYLESVFGNSSLFDFSVSRSDALDYEGLGNVDLIVLDRFVQIPKGLIGQGVESSSILIFPPDSIDLQNYGSESSMTINEAESIELQEVELESGSRLMAGAFEVGTHADLPKAVGKYTISSTHEQILTFRDGNTFLGRSVDLPIYFLNSPLNEKYTELAEHAIFLPIMYRIAEESVDSGTRLFSYPGESLEIDQLSTKGPPKIVSNSIELIPEFVSRNDKGLVKVPSNLAPGFYHVIDANDTLRSFGLNVSKSESVFNGLSYEEIVSYFSRSEHVKVFSVFDELEHSTLVSQRSNHLWKYALILAVLFLLVETLFHRYLK